jgi:threonine/homoserine/homoserine lactone efflux protein
MIAIFVAGFVLGAVISIPLGALGALMIDRTIRGGLWAGFSLGLISAVVTALCSGLSLSGMSLMIRVPILRILVQGIGLVFLLYMGIRYLFSPKRDIDFVNTVDTRERKWLSNRQSFQLENIVIVLMYEFFNPTAIAFWANMAGMLHSSILRLSGINEYVLFSAAVGLGSASSQLVSLILVQKANEKSKATRGGVRRFSLVVFISTIAFFSYSLAKEIFSQI